MADDTVAPVLGVLNSMAINQNLPNHKKGSDSYGEADERERRQGSGHKNINDIASVLGIAAERLPDDILESVSKLLNELEYLHWKVKNLEGRVRYSEEKADFHYVLPLFNRGAFVRELEKRIRHFENVGMSGILLMFELHNFSELREKYGTFDAENVLTALALIIKDAVKASYVVGAIDYGRIGVVMPFETPEAADELTTRVKTAAHGYPFAINGEPVKMLVYSGYTVIEGNDIPKAALKRADRNIRP